jgi:hypothetical protein
VDELEKVVALAEASRKAHGGGGGWLLDPEGPWGASDGEATPLHAAVAMGETLLVGRILLLAASCPLEAADEAGDDAMLFGGGGSFRGGTFSSPSNLSGK